ncbi:phosphoribosylanthranilate isomerase [Arenibacter sp. F26102]|uniref:phosphoribosylanthranilate isomerase n=1 Tax=Arenibacter sp. F26102 TaxID=2926416 RepID=UPI001FF0F3D4|nr:phosphoribosylanthranilate isomerase [Arenibacter sp. F26102]MCK0147325.1 phosphoribosylanthranilate isomerase [Arenibacter sp. F26102]
MKLKVCGMNLNTLEVATLYPDYLGFIFWKPSKRFNEGNIPQLPPSIKKVGVFVDATIEEVLEKIETFGLDAVQLHGKESPEFCSSLKRFINDRTKALGAANLKIIKVFSIKDDFDFGVLTPYEEVCDYYLFDTKGKLPGGNGYTFSWEVLKNYHSTKPYFLSGGIGLDEIEKIKEFKKRPESKYCHAIDVNSKFELEPGLKDIDKLKEFKEVLGIG